MRNSITGIVKSPTTLVLVAGILILVGLACWIRAYIVLTSSNDPGDLQSQFDSPVSTYLAQRPS